MGSTPVVLIAQLDDNKTLYAVEYDSRGLYVVFKLGSWVDLDKLCSVAVVSRPCSSPRKHDTPQGVLDGVVPAHDALASAESGKYSKKKRLAIEAIQSMVKRQSTSQSLNIGPTADPESLDTVPPESRIQDGHPAPIQAPQDTALEQPRPEDILDSVRAQYLDTLYLSKVSYMVQEPFAHSPLTYIGLNSILCERTFVPCESCFPFGL
jgi:DNA replication regulator SLD3